MVREEYTLKNRPTPVVSFVPERQERFITTETKEWFVGFEKDLPFKRGILAHTLYNFLKNVQGYAVVPSVTILEDIIQRWIDKEILGE